MNCEFEDNILQVNGADFDELALKVFRFQYDHNEIYRQFVNVLGVNINLVNSLDKIPFLPIAFFKSHIVKTTEFLPEYIFQSSGTTQSIPSRHYIRALSWYKRSFRTAFELFYGKAEEWCIIGLLPSYLEREDSSLVMMVNDLIEMSRHPQSGFYLDEHDKLFAVLQELEIKNEKTLLIGVTFGLLDFVENHSLHLSNIVVMETGGMKGRREELTRAQVHAILKERLGIKDVHSEYGMTELLSQAYSKENGIFYCPAWMKVLVRDEDDPLFVSNAVSLRKPPALNGILNIIDLANIYSCAFIATDDLGKVYRNGSFKVLGRVDNSDIRGCSLMAI